MNMNTPGKFTQVEFRKTALIIQHEEHFLKTIVYHLRTKQNAGIGELG